MTYTHVEVNPLQEPFRRSFETMAILELMRNAKDNELVSYARMKEAMNGVDPQGKGRCYIQSAKDILENDGIIFRCLANEGYLRLPPDAAIKHTREMHKRRFKNDTKRFRTKVEGIDPSKLTKPDSRQTYALSVAELSLRETIGSKEAERRIIKHISEKPAQSLGMGKEAGDELMKLLIESGFKG